MKLNVSIILVAFLLGTQSSAQVLPQDQYNIWLTNGLSSGSKFDVTASSRIVKENTDYTYEFRIKNIGPELVMVQWDVLDKFISGNFQNLVSLGAGEVKEFSFRTNLEPTISETNWLRVYQRVDAEMQEDKENEVLDLQNLGKLTLPKGQILQQKSGMGVSIGFIPLRFQ